MTLIIEAKAKIVLDTPKSIQTPSEQDPGRRNKLEIINPITTPPIREETALITVGLNSIRIGILGNI